MERRIPRLLGCLEFYIMTKVERLTNLTYYKGDPVFSFR